MKIHVGAPADVRTKNFEEVVSKITTTLPDKSIFQWSSRLMAGVIGCSHSTVQSIGKAANLKPHLLRIFKRSNDSNYVEKVREVSSLYTVPPNSIVVCLDDKNQIPALERP
jgi:hypothetical protein